MSLSLKIGSLAIRTLAKPIANYIKRQAREHDKFRGIAINFAQRVHRIDMRLRLGLLQDPAVIERQIAREEKAAEQRRQKAEIPTVKTEAQTKAEEREKEKEKKEVTEKVRDRHKPKIRPLSEAKAIETGANFASEVFLFLVAAGLIVGETWRSRRKESTRREDVADRIEALEAEKEELRRKVEMLEERVTAASPPVPKQTAPKTLSEYMTASKANAQQKAAPQQSSGPQLPPKR